jgi:hypothetical protein
LQCVIRRTGPATAGGDLADQAHAVAADGVAGGGVVGADRLGLGPRRLARVQRAASGCSARRMRSSAQCRFTAVGRVAPRVASACASVASFRALFGERERDPEGRGGADQRCAAHLHAADRVRGLGEGAQRDGLGAEGQQGLVEDMDDLAVAAQGGDGLFEHRGALVEGGGAT